MYAFHRKFRNFISDLRGTVSVEFILMVPVILVIYTLTFAVFHAYLQSSRAAKAIYTASDIVSRYNVVTEDNLAQIQSLLDTLYIGNSDTFDLRVSRISYISDDAIADAAAAAAAAGDPSLFIDPSDFFEADEGYYFVDWSRVMPFDDATTPDADEGSERTALVNDDLANYDLPTMGSGAHTLLVNAGVDYISPLAGRQLFFDIGSFFSQMRWSHDVFIWPRDPRGIFLETPAGVVIPAT